MKKSKDDIYFDVCNTVLKMEIAKGHLKWTVSDIARFSGVTRTLIYYYFDKDKSVILEEAYKYMISVFFNTDPTKAMGMHERVKKILQDLQKMPYMFVHYYLEKNKQSKLGLMIQKAESEIIDYLHQHNPSMDKKEIFDIYLKELGTIAFQLPPEEVTNHLPNI